MLVKYQKRNDTRFNKALRIVLWNILHKDLGLKAYKVQLTQERFSQPIINNVVYLLEMHENYAEFKRKIILTHEADIHLDDYVNKQNCLIWGSENPIFITEP